MERLSLESVEVLVIGSCDQFSRAAARLVWYRCPLALAAPALSAGITRGRPRLTNFPS